MVDVQIAGHKLVRLNSIRGALQKFQSDPKLLGVRLSLPKDILAGKNFEGLKVALIPFQAELAAIEFEMHIGADLVYNLDAQKDKIDELVKQRPIQTVTALTFQKMLHDYKIPPPKNAAELSIVIQTLLQSMVARGFKNPKFVFMGKKLNGQKFPLGYFSCGGYISELIRDSKESDTNLFSIVRCPLYPKTFGRYSEDLQIVLSREADFTSLPTEVRRKIRFDSNAELQRHGVKINELTEDKQPDGLWIPD